ncbi:MAG: hypothetical protein IKH07_02990 [Oscillospiraceae bacterium]|nr:hypothetical protein [Oscillospiraceae bacterium]
MTKEEYCAAFSRLQPSQEAVDRLLAISEEAQPKTKRPIRFAALLAAAVLALLLLGGTVYAISHWFRLSAEPTLTERPHKEVDGPTQPTDPPKPQVGIEIEDAGSGNYVGFTLDGFSIPGADTRGTNSMQSWLDYHGLAQDAALPGKAEGAYQRYYAAAPDGELLCVEVLDSTGIGYRSYFTRYEAELVREGTFNGLEIVWLRIVEPGLGDTWHLFCRDAALGCTLVVSSSRDFARCEEVAEHLTLVDTGVPIRLSDTKTVFGLGLVELPEGFRYWENVPLSVELLNAAPADPGQNLTALWRSQILSRKDGSNLSISVRGERFDYTKSQSATLIKTGELNGHAARWYRNINYTDPSLTTQGPPSTILVIWYEELGCEVEIWASQEETELHPGELEEIAAMLEPVPVVLTEEAPVEFHGLAQG